MNANCYFCNFGAVHNLKFNTDTSELWNSEVRSPALNENIRSTYNFENISFYFLAYYIKSFFEKYSNYKKLIIYTAIDSVVLNKMIVSPANDSEKYLADMVNNKRIAFSGKGDEVLSLMAKKVAYKYFQEKRDGTAVKFIKTEIDPFTDMFSDRYGVYN
jgi:hypothetical protein